MSWGSTVSVVVPSTRTAPVGLFDLGPGTLDADLFHLVLGIAQDRGVDVQRHAIRMDVLAQHVAGGTGDPVTMADLRPARALSNSIYRRWGDRRSPPSSPRSRGPAWPRPHVVQLGR